MGKGIKTLNEPTKLKCVFWEDVKGENMSEKFNKSLLGFGVYQATANYICVARRTLMAGLDE